MSEAQSSGNRQRIRADDSFHCTDHHFTPANPAFRSIRNSRYFIRAQLALPSIHMAGTLVSGQPEP